MGKAALILVVGFAVLVGIVGTSITERTTEAQKASMGAYEATQARNIAKSAQDITTYALRVDSTLTGQYTIRNLLGGNAAVSIAEKNPGDRSVLILNATGKYGLASRDVSGEMVDTIRYAPPVTGAVGIAFRSRAKIKMNKNTFIDGNNHDLDGNPSASYAAVSGISLGHPDQLANLDYNPKDVKIKGKGSVEPDIDVYVTQRDYYAWAMRLAAGADVKFKGKQISKKDIPTLGTVTDPQITYVDGNTRFNDEVIGAGILIVNGKCEFKKTIDFVGLIIAVGDSIHSEKTGFGGKGSQIIGAVMVAGKKTDAKFGDIDIFYSGEAVRRAMFLAGERIPRSYVLQNVWE
jgi:hypothetical protein